MPVSCTRVPGAWPMISSFALAAARTTGRGPSGSSAAQSRQARASAMIRPSSRSAFEDLPAIAEDPLDEGRHLDAGGAVAALAEQRMTFRRLEIQLHRVSMSIAAHIGDDAGRRIDGARGDTTSVRWGKTGAVGLASDGGRDSKKTNT